MNKIKLIYDKLFEAFGPQNWWPGDTDFEVCIGAILTQNTNWQNVEKAIKNLKDNKILSLKNLKEVNTKKLASLIRPSGYYNQKAKKLKNFVNYVYKNYNGSLKGFFGSENLRSELLSINGIGPETADSIILYAAKKPIFVIDAYTKRIFSRLGYAEQSYEALQELFMKNLGKNERLFNEYHALIVHLGKNLCKKVPFCEDCPLNKMSCKL